MKLILKYADQVFIIIIAAILVWINETGLLVKFANYELVLLLFAYYFGKLVANWQNKAIKPKTEQQEKE